jgi:hypothetical protein
MKTALILILFAASAFAQQAPVPVPAACGPLEVKFDTETSNAQPPAQPDPGKALVFVAEDFPPVPGQIGGPTIRIGLDDAWMGATHGSSFIFFSVDPGEHHLCVKWQSHLSWFSKLASFAHLTAEAGKTYYFRTRITDSKQWGSIYLDLDPVDPDQGQYLVASSRLSVSHAKK